MQDEVLLPPKSIEMQRELPGKGLPAAIASDLARCALHKIEDQSKNIRVFGNKRFVFGECHESARRDVGPVLLHAEFAGQTDIQEAVRILRAAGQQFAAETGIRSIGAVISDAHTFAALLCGKGAIDHAAAVDHRARFAPINGERKVRFTFFLRFGVGEA